MKLAMLIWSRVRQYWKYHKLLLCLFLIGGTLSSVVFCYFYGNSLQLMEFLTSDDPYYRRYNVYLALEMGTDIPRPDFEISFEGLEKVAQNELAESVTMFAWFFSFEEDDGIIEGDNATLSYGLAAQIGDRPELPMFSGSTDLKAEPDGVIVPYFSNLVAGDTVRICGVERKVIGKTKDDFYYVAYEFYRSIGAPVDEATVISRGRLDLENDPLTSILQEAFPECTLRTPANWARAFEKRAIEDTLYGVCPIYLVSLISFMYLLRYLMDTTTSMVAVSRIVGARKWQIFGLCLAEVLALCALVTGTGIGVHIWLYDSVFVHLNSLENLVYRIVDYWAAFAYMMGLNVLVALFFVRKYASIPPIALRRQAE
ncbi:MAG: hypothetical protein IKC09_05960 [Oscillospiraceae bacterium]|nr:hypothetical protein [Oscillospiraceae bacterium]